MSEIKCECGEEIVFVCRSDSGKEFWRPKTHGDINGKDGHWHKPAEPVIEAAPGEPTHTCSDCYAPIWSAGNGWRDRLSFRCHAREDGGHRPGEPDGKCPHCGAIGGHRMCGPIRFETSPAVPAQEAPREHNARPFELSGKAIAAFSSVIKALASAEPQAGAQELFPGANDMRAPTGMENLRDTPPIVYEGNMAFAQFVGVIEEAEQAGAQPDTEPAGVCVVCDAPPAVYKPGGWRCLHCANQCEDCDDAVCRKTKPGPCDCSCHVQAGAQVPSQDYKEMWLKAVDHGLAQHIIKVRENTKLREELGRVNTHLNSIKSYATEAAKLPKCTFCRQLIQPGPGGDLYALVTGAFCPQNHTSVGHEYDEMYGLCRLVLSEIGGGQ